MAATRVIRRPCRTMQADVSRAVNSPSTVNCSLRLPAIAPGGGVDGRRSAPCGDISCKKTVSAAVLEVAIVDRPRMEKESVLDVRDVVEALVGAVGALKPALKGKSWKRKAQRAIERLIFDFRFFSLIGVVGSLLGSILCFLEGCYKIVQASAEYFRGLLQRPEQGEMVLKLMEAINMFLVGTAMLTFGTALYHLFISSRQKNQHLDLSGSNLFGHFQLKNRPSWVEVESVSEMKTKIGQAVVMLLHVGLLEKFQNVSISTPLDLACFAASILVSSACVFLLSKLAYNSTPRTITPNDGSD